MRAMKRIGAVCAAMMLAATASAQTLYFSAIPDEDETALMTRFSKVADYSVAIDG